MAIVHELISNTVIEQGLGPLTQTGDAPMVGAVVDTRDSQHVAFFIQTGALATPGATFAITVQHGDAANLSDAIAADPACLVGSLSGAAFTGANANSTRKLGYSPGKGAGRRYVRLTITPTGNTGAAAISVAAVKLPLRTP